MYKLGVALLAVSLNAIADTLEELRARVRTDTVDSLCTVQILRPELAQIARDELTSRKAKCDWGRTRLQTDVFLQQQQLQAQKQQAAVTEQKQTEAAQAAARQAEQQEGQHAAEAYDRQRQLDMQQQQINIQAQRAKDEASSQAMQNLNQAVQNMRPRPYVLPSPPQQTQCQTVYYPGGARTVCQ